MNYKVRLHRTKLLPYEVDVKADTPEAAIEKAKDIVANIGFWENKNIPIENKKQLLVVDYVKEEVDGE